MVKITEELLQKADQIPNFSDGVIMPDGDYRLIEEKGHLQTENENIYKGYSINRGYIGTSGEPERVLGL